MNSRNKQRKSARTVRSPMLMLMLVAFLQGLLPEFLQEFPPRLWDSFKIFLNFSRNSFPKVPKKNKFRDWSRNSFWAILPRIPSGIPFVFSPDIYSGFHIGVPSVIPQQVPQEASSEILFGIPTEVRTFTSEILWGFLPGLLLDFRKSSKNYFRDSFGNSLRGASNSFFWKVFRFYLFPERIPEKMESREELLEETQKKLQRELLIELMKEFLQKLLEELLKELL